jgi:hypothetical protein
MAFKPLIAACLSLATLNAPLLADAGTSTAAAPTTKSDASDPNKVICRRIETIGSRLDSKRVCRTKGDWDAEQALNRQTLEQSQNMRGARGN